MIQIFKLKSYKEFINQYIETLPRKGHGELRKISLKLNIHTTTMSQIFHGDKNLTLEQAADLSDYLGLDELETNYFITLVQFERAGSFKLKQKLEKQLQFLQKQNQLIANKFKNKTELTHETQALFYSNWYYSGIRVLSSLSGMDNADIISQRLGISKKTATEAIKFLVQTGLCEWKEQKLVPGPTQTFVGADSPFLNNHRTNWHLKAIENFKNLNETDLVFSAPLTISKAGKQEIRQGLTQLIQTISDKAVSSEAEEMVICNLNWIGL